jgi:signal transduction histidine kinase/ligand-binding sensor protein/ActR/RegA family two-component response regulator
MDTAHMAAEEEFNKLHLAGLALVVLLSLFLLSQHNFLLFHVIAEFFSIAVAWSVFLLVWNSRRIVQNDAMVFLGITYLSVGVIDLIHTLSYKGMGIFPDYLAANYATQLWISARSLEAISLLLFTILISRRRIRPGVIFLAYGVVTALVMASIFSWHLFPDCYIEGSGLTTFKKTAEYLICLTLAISIAVLFRKRGHLDTKVFSLIAGAMALSIAGELAFTFYVSVYGLSNVAGHFFKIISFFLIYIALIRSSFIRPYKTLFRSLEQEKSALKKSEEAARKKIQAILEPKGDISSLNLGDIINREALRSMLEEFYKLTNISTAVIDLSGNVLVTVKWQDICAKFHRFHCETNKNCLESDTILSHGVQNGTFKAYRCKNNLWDMATPLVVGGRHMGNIFIGQFFYDDETLDYDLFRRKAREYGFDEAEYLAALDRVPRLSRETVDSAMAFCAKLAGMISSLSYSNITLAQILSQQELTMEELGERDQDLKESQRIAHLGSWRWDITTNELFWSDELYRIYRLDPRLGPVPYNEQYKLFTTESWDRLSKTVSETMDTGIIYELELETIRQGEGNGWVWIRCETIRNAGGVVVGLRGAAQDITERKHADEEKMNLQAQLRQAQKMESVGRLAGGVAHDFNNMLGVIIGYADIIFEQIDPDQPIHNDLEQIRNAAQRSADLTRQLLAFARRQTIVPEVLDLNQVVEEMLNMLHRLIGEDINLTWIPGENLGPVNMDPSQIDQILANLCVNARDAILDVGKVTIETGDVTFDQPYCATHGEAVPGEFVLLAVSDDGCGMVQETMSNIFDPFFTTKQQGKGTGLGLSTIYGIVKQNNGFINVYSEPGLGTTFRIYLPRHTGKTNTIQDRDSEMDNGQGHGTETILLVEDELSILKMTTMMLERMDYKVLAAGSPEEALYLAGEYSGMIHILITDVVMPEMNGWDLAEKISDIYPNINRLFMSGYTANVIAHHGVLKKGVNFIQKPFSQKDLAARVRETLDHTSE